MNTLVLLRHGESEWNKENRFTGWVDVDLSEKGIIEATDAGKILLEEGYVFDEAHTSYLTRAIHTQTISLKELDLESIPKVQDWRLNERHYGALQGLNKAETAAKYGEEQVKIWRRSYDVRPPLITKESEMYPGKDPRYSKLTESEIPLGECLKDTVNRVIPYWNQVLAPAIASGKTILINGHGNSMRALVKHLDEIPDQDIVELNIPTGIPLVYHLDDDLKPIKHFYLAEESELNAALQTVKNQGKAK